MLWASHSASNNVTATRCQIARTLHSTATPAPLRAAHRGFCEKKQCSAPPSVGLKHTPICERSDAAAVPPPSSHCPATDFPPPAAGGPSDVRRRNNHSSCRIRNGDCSFRRPVQASARNLYARADPYVHKSSVKVAVRAGRSSSPYVTVASAVAIGCRYRTCRYDRDLRGSIRGLGDTPTRPWLRRQTFVLTLCDSQDTY